MNVRQTLGALVVSITASQTPMPVYAIDFEGTIDHVGDAVTDTVTNAFEGNPVSNFLQQRELRKRILEIEQQHRVDALQEYRTEHGGSCCVPSVVSRVALKEVFTLDKITMNDLGVVSLLDHASPQDAEKIAHYAKDFEAHYNAWEAQKYVVYHKILDQAFVHMRQEGIRPSLLTERKMWGIVRETVPKNDWDQLYTHQEGMYTAALELGKTLALADQSNLADQRKDGQAQVSVYVSTQVSSLPQALLTKIDPYGALPRVRTGRDALSVLEMYRDVTKLEQKAVQKQY